MQKLSLRVLPILVLCFFLPVRAASEADLAARIADLERQIAELRRALAAAPGGSGGSTDERLADIERKIAVLADELAAVRRGEKGTEALTSAGEPASGAPQGLAPAASKVYRSKGGVSIGGYGEVLYQDFSRRADDGSTASSADEADALRAVFYFGYKFTDRIVFNSEIEFEHGTTGQGGEASIEFAYVDFMLDPRINLRAGQVLVPVGLINELHEPPVFLGAKRPDLETNVLPSTWRDVGVGAYGDVGPFTWRAYLLTGLRGSRFTAGTGIRGGRQSGARGRAEDRAIALRADLTGVPGLLAGVSWYSGNSGQEESVTRDGDTRTMPDANVTLFDVHADWKWRGLQLRGVWARVEIEDTASIAEVTGQTVGSEIDGWYGEAGYDVLAATRWNRHALIPFVRYEAYDTQAEVAPGLARSLANDREVFTYGLVYKPIPQVAVKADFQDRKNAAGTAVDQINVALGFYF